MAEASVDKIQSLQGELKRINAILSLPRYLASDDAVKKREEEGEE